MTGELFFNTVNTSGWVDAYTAYGLSLEDGSLSRLMTPAPHKDFVRNKNIFTDGTSVAQDTFFKDARQLSLEVHICAPDKAAFLDRYGAFCADILDAGYIKLKTSHQPNTVYHFIYMDCQQFTQFHLQTGKFTLTLEEPNPSVRT